MKKYFKIFRSTKRIWQKEGNYANYIGSNLCNGKTIVPKVSQENFFNFLKKEMKEFDKNPEWISILDEMNKDNFFTENTC